MASGAGTFYVVVHAPLTSHALTLVTRLRGCVVEELRVNMGRPLPFGHLASGLLPLHVAQPVHPTLVGNFTEVNGVVTPEQEFSLVCLAFD